MKLIEGSLAMATMKCGVCNGTGKTGGSTCSSCGGAGSKTVGN